MGLSLLISYTGRRIVSPATRQARPSRAEQSTPRQLTARYVLVYCVLTRALSCAMRVLYSVCVCVVCVCCAVPCACGQRACDCSGVAAPSAFCTTHLGTTWALSCLVLSCRGRCGWAARRVIPRSRPPLDSHNVLLPRQHACHDLQLVGAAHDRGRQSARADRRLPRGEGGV
jgi:hypothetical protein